MMITMTIMMISMSQGTCLSVLGIVGRQQLYPLAPPCLSTLCRTPHHCTPLHTTVLKHCTAFSYILSIQDVGTANLAVLEEPELRAEQCKKYLLAAISVQ